MKKRNIHIKTFIKELEVESWEKLVQWISRGHGWEIFGYTACWVFWNLKVDALDDFVHSLDDLS